MISASCLCYHQSNCSISDVMKTSRVCVCSNHLNIQLELTEHLGVAGADLLQHVVARLVQTRPHSACLRIIWILEREKWQNENKTKIQNIIFLSPESRNPSQSWLDRSGFSFFPCLCSSENCDLCCCCCCCCCCWRCCCCCAQGFDSTSSSQPLRPSET